MNWNDLPEFFGAKELAKFMGIGNNAAYELCRRNGFPAIRVGRSIRISREGLKRWTEEQTNPQNREKQYFR